MAENNYIKHAFVSPKSDGPDTTLVRPSNWNDGLVYAGGINGQILVYDNTQDNNMRWVDGRVIGATALSIVSSTATPIVGAATQVRVFNSAIAYTATLIVNALTSVGAAAITVEMQIDGVTISGGQVSFPSGVTPTTFMTGAPVGSGTRTFSLRLTTVGAVNILTANLVLLVDSFGV